RKKVQEDGLPVKVNDMAITSQPADEDIVITHQDLTDRARKHAPNAEHISLNNFLDSALYSQLVTQLIAAKRQAANDSQLIKPSILAAND
nr:PTS mannitol transporter subunit IICBA [Vibrio cholerae]